MKGVLTILAMIGLAILSMSCSSKNNELNNKIMVEQRELESLEAIKNAYGKKGHEYDVTLFVNHHLEELDADYWEKLLGTASPNSSQILGALILKDKWNSKGGEVYNFSLPNSVTNYVISVMPNVGGGIHEISMES